MEERGGEEAEERRPGQPPPLSIKCVVHTVNKIYEFVTHFE